MSARSFSMSKTKKFGNVKISNTPDQIIVTLHKTDVVVYNKNDGSIRLNTGGWHTPTTKTAINNALSQLEDITGHNFPRISQVKGKWYLGEMEFRDGMKYAKRKLNPMRRMTDEYNIGHLEDFSPKIQEKIIDKYRDINVDHDWWEYTYEDMKNILGILGFDYVEISFSGFSSQGDGASFTGYFKPAKKSELKHRVKVLHKDYAPDFPVFGFEQMEFSEEELEDSLKIERIDSRYSHENTVTTDNEDLKEFVRNFSHYIYRQLEREYDYLTSDEAVRETIEANEYEFDERTLKIV